MKNIYKLSVVLLLTFLFLGLNCSEPTPPPPPNNGTLTLSITETSCTEAWLELKTNGVAFPVNVNLLKDNTVAQTISLGKNDTTVYIDSLLPNKSYELQAQFSQSNQTTSSNKITVQTLDTTSSNFTWQTYTFGDPNAGSSHLSDVAIINENNIWAVGEIYADDSTGQPDPHAYSLAHWDGSKWELKRLYDTNNQLIPSIRGIYYFSPSDIWLADGGIHHWDGVSQMASQSFDRISLIGGTENGQSVNKIWGTNANDLYGVGYKGMITHYNGTNWQKIESGTTTNLNDIWGYYDQVNYNLSVLTVASNIFQQGEHRLLAISGNLTVDTLNWQNTQSLKGLWFAGKYLPVYVCGGGIREYKQGGWSTLNLPPYFTNSIRGSDVNDVIAVGDYGFITHYNGVSWYSQNLSSNYELSSVAIKNNTVAIAGYSTNGFVVGSAIIIIGKR